MRQAALSARAETLLAMGRPAEAMAEEGMRLGGDPDWGRVAWRLRSARVRALAQAALGDQHGAAAALDALIAEGEAIDSPTLCGMLHEARVRVALLAGGRDAYTTHRDAVRQRFRGTRNPALVARADPLVEAAGAVEISTEHVVEMLGEDVAAVRGASRRSMWLSEVLDRCATGDERAGRALEVILEETGAHEGHLDLWRDGGSSTRRPRTGATLRRAW